LDVRYGLSHLKTRSTHGHMIRCVRFDDVMTFPPATATGSVDQGGAGHIHLHAAAAGSPRGELFDLVLIKGTRRAQLCASGTFASSDRLLSPGLQPPTHQPPSHLPELLWPPSRPVCVPPSDPRVGDGAGRHAGPEPAAAPGGAHQQRTGGEGSGEMMWTLELRHCSYWRDCFSASSVRPT
jgi:hypothetical protein